MSLLTKKILSSVDYRHVKKRREENFFYLHEEFSKINEIELQVNHLNGPMIYPLVISKNGIKERLFEKKIYVATYWKEVKNRVGFDDIEMKFSNYLIPLPIDQRYGLNEMRYIVSIFKQILFKKN